MDKNIQYILEVARQGGITKAANKLYITPSALSRFVQARESELNVLLFHRVGKRFVPTEAGKYYIQKCQEIEQLQLELNFIFMKDTVFRKEIQNLYEIICRHVK